MATPKRSPQVCGSLGASSFLSRCQKKRRIPLTSQTHQRQSDLQSISQLIVQLRTGREKESGGCSPLFGVVLGGKSRGGKELTATSEVYAAPTLEDLSVDSQLSKPAGPVKIAR